MILASGIDLLLTDQRASLGSSAGKEPSCNVGDPGSIPGLGRFPGERIGSPIQHSGLENSMDCVVHGVSESDTTE